MVFLIDTFDPINTNEVNSLDLEYIMVNNSASKHFQSLTLTKTNTFALVLDLVFYKPPRVTFGSF